MNVLVYRSCRIRDVEHLKEVMQTCWEQIGQGVIDRAIPGEPKKIPPTTFVDITAMHGNFCTKFYTIVKRSNIHFITKFY